MNVIHLNFSEAFSDWLEAFLVIVGTLVAIAGARFVLLSGRAIVVGVPWRVLRRRRQSDLDHRIQDVVQVAPLNEKLTRYLATRSTSWSSCFSLSWSDAWRS